MKIMKNYTRKKKWMWVEKIIQYETVQRHLANKRLVAQIVISSWGKYVVKVLTLNQLINHKDIKRMVKWEDDSHNFVSEVYWFSKMSNFRNIYNVPFKVLKFMGLWNAESKNPKLNFWYTLYQAFSFLFFLIFVALTFIDLYIHRHDVQKVSTNLTISISLWVLLWKNINILQHYHRVQNLKRQICDGLLPNRDAEDEGLLMKGVKETKYACILIYGMCATTMTLWCFSPLFFKTDQKFPISIYIPWAHDKTPFLQLTYAYHVCCTFYASFNILTINLSFMCLVIGICAEYDVLVKNTRRISKLSKKFFFTNHGINWFYEKQNKTLGDKLVGIIHHHQKIIYVVGEVEHCYVRMMLVQFVGGGVVLTVLALDFIMATKTLNMRATSIILLFSLVSIDLFLFCNLGTRIIDKNDEFLRALYELPWDAMNIKNQKLVYIMMQRITDPIKLTIQKFATLNLTTILNLAKAFYNLLYLLLHITEKKNTGS